MLTLSQAIGLYVEAKRAKRLSQNTLNDYLNTYKIFRGFLGGDPRLSEIDARTIAQFMASQHVQEVSRKTALNYHIGLSSLWRWLTEQGYAGENVVRQVSPPRRVIREIVPYTRLEIVDLLAAAEDGLKPLRDQAIILLLLDTGIRASELASLRVRDLSVQRSIRVIGKGEKERTLRVSARTCQAISDYLDSRSKARNQPLFLSDREPFTRNGLRLMLERLSARSGVHHAHAHRFRHTFAIQFLRNGGNVFTLQRFLGHTTLEMVGRYLAIAQIDLDREHDRASPVANWNL